MEIRKIQGGPEGARETWLFDDGKRGTATVTIRVDPPCSAEEMTRNRQRIDAALRRMARCAPRN